VSRCVLSDKISVIFNLRHFTVLTYVGVSATNIGISSDFAFYFVAIANASSLFGRYLAGSLADRVGAVSTPSSKFLDTYQTCLSQVP
jgi:hypothetical protein